MANLLNPIAGLPLGHPEGGETLIGTIPASMAEQLQALQPERPEHESQGESSFRCTGRLPRLTSSACG
jgi:hypothetical protein